MQDLTIALVGLASFLLASDPHIARKAARAYGPTTPPAPLIFVMRLLAGAMACLSGGLLLLRLSQLF